ncbi:MAG: hypothetical protein IJ733_11645 [Lachnospiraceae bacterium]|nr:hypothetical protein [Lachnospiraceae bacterium]
MSDSSKLITDKRQIYLKNMLQEKGYSVFLAEELSMQEKRQLFSQVHSAPFLYLLPVPAPEEELNFLKIFSNPQAILLGGNFPRNFTDFCLKRKIAFVDYMRAETVVMENAIATAESIISHAILETPINIQSSKALVIGYGKCGEILAEKLHALHADVFIATRNPLARKRAECYGYHIHKSSFFAEYDFIFNTAPAMVLPKETIDLLKQDACIFDIASKPGGTDFSYCEEKGIKAKLYPGLPGKYAPKSSAEIIFRYLLTVL